MCNISTKPTSVLALYGKVVTKLVWWMQKTIDWLVIAIIELNPVRASMVTHPGGYRWSSHGVNAGMRPRKALVAHEAYQRLGLNDESRYHGYRELFSIGLDKTLLHDIQRATTFSMPLGNTRFLEQIEKALNRRLGYARRGRPVKIRYE